MSTQYTRKASFMTQCTVKYPHYFIIYFIKKKNVSTTFEQPIKLILRSINGLEPIVLKKKKALIESSVVMDPHISENLEMQIIVV